LATPRTVGNGHLKAALADAGRRLDAIAFNWADRAAPMLAGPVDVAFKLERNEYQGRTALQAKVVTLGPAAR
jgi:hypothetical protein